MPVQEEKIEIQEGEEERLDLFLTRRFPDISRSYLQKMISKPLVRVNGKKVKKGYVLQSSDVVEISSFERPEEREIRPNPQKSLKVLFEKEDVLVIDKPAGLPTHPNDFDDLATVANLAIGQFPEMKEVGDDPLRPGIVHRLDTDTSGVLLLARSQEAFRALRGQFDRREVKKRYLALVLGKIEEETEIDRPVAHHPTNPRKMVVVEEGTRYRSTPREAKTSVKPIEAFDGYTLLEVRTWTGRMHQVRVHLSGIGHPLTGDRLYQSHRFRKNDKTGLKRHFLHASRIQFSLPHSQASHTVDSKLPEELDVLLQGLRQA